jgi:hypothetical protein
MYETGIDAVMDATFGAIAARAARYPVVVKKSQPRTIMKGAACSPVAADQGIRWLLLNAQRTTLSLKGTG